jgi:hypothetical protein
MEQEELAMMIDDDDCLFPGSSKVPEKKVR